MYGLWIQLLKTFGELGRGFIHVHHIKPLSTTGECMINPVTDLVTYAQLSFDDSQKKRPYINSGRFNTTNETEKVD